MTALFISRVGGSRGLCSEQCRSSRGFVAICPVFEVKNVTVQHEDKEGFFFLSAEVYFTERNLLERSRVLFLSVFGMDLRVYSLYCVCLCILYNFLFTVSTLPVGGANSICQLFSRLQRPDNV